MLGVEANGWDRQEQGFRASFTWWRISALAEAFPPVYVRAGLAKYTYLRAFVSIILPRRTGQQLPLSA